MESNRVKNYRSETFKSGQGGKRVFCSVCRRDSFLKCMMCDTIYCSTVCQVKDWEQHQHTHGAPKLSQASIKAAPVIQHKTSVQSRLQVAVNKPISKIYYEKIKEADDATKENDDPTKENDDPNQLKQLNESSSASSPAPTQISHPQNECDVLSQSLEAIKIAEKPIQKSLKLFVSRFSFQDITVNSDGFIYVIISEITQNEDGTNVFWFQPFENKEEYDNYKNKLQDDYSGEDFIEIKGSLTFKDHLVIAMINDSWCRARIIGFTEPDVFCLEDVDSGRKTITTCFNTLKAPRITEIFKPPFAFKASLENLIDPSSVELGDLIKIRLIRFNQMGLSVAEAQLTMPEDEESINELVEASVTQDNQGASNRLLIDQMRVKDIQVGPDVKLLFLDGAKLDSGIIYVCESSSENSVFFSQLSKEIADHVQSASRESYQPVANEMILAKFSDGCYYRAVCLNVIGVDAKVFFVDFGNFFLTKLEDIMKMPVNLLYNCCTSPVKVKPASGRSIEEIDAKKTELLLMEKGEFRAKVEWAPANVLVVTLEESLIKYKTA